LFLILVATLMIPYQVTLIPRLSCIPRLLGRHPLPAVGYRLFGGVRLATFLIRQFYLTIPLELAGIRSLDGAQYLPDIPLYLCPFIRVALATLAIFTFMWSWNDLLTPLIYLREMKQLTLTAG